MGFLRLLLALLILAFGYWLVTKSGLLHRGEETSPAGTPIERARAAARASEQRNAQTEGAQRAADAPANPGTVTENMSPDQVRALLGQPSDIRTETTDSGARRERWVYAAVGKTVVFENGVVVSVE